MEFEDILASIKDKFDKEDFEAALKLCAKAAELEPDNGIVAECKIFATLSLSRWNDALTLVAKKDDLDSIRFEKAYCLYRINKFQEALDLIPKKTEQGKSDAWTRLEAQVRYRMGLYAESAALYEKLFKDDAEDVGLIVNAVASHVSGDRPHEALAKLAEAGEDLLDSSYELSFNTACALIEEGKLDDAERRLEQAKQICLTELNEDEDLDPEDADLLEDNAELAAIHVQRGCVLQRRGKIEEANTLYSKVLRQRSDADEVDVTVLAVACNNVVALRSEGKSLFDSLKRINIASKESLEHKLTRKQSIAIAVNKVLLLLQAHKLDEARREVAVLKKTWANHPRVLIAAAAISHHEKKYKACEEALQGFLQQEPDSEEVALALVQLYSEQQKADKAVEALGKLPLATRVRPAMLQTIVALHQKLKAPEKAIAALREAIAHYQKQDDEDVTFPQVLQIASSAAMRLKDSAFAAEAYQLYLEKVDGTDTDALCGLVQALSSTDVDKAEQYAKRLKIPTFDHLDPEELEQAAIPKINRLAQPKKRSPEEGEEAAEEEGGEDGKTVIDKDAARRLRIKEKRKRKRKILYPKNFDPENPGPAPDPERWLPKRERTEYKKRMKKRQKDLLRGPQGAVPTDGNDFRKQGPSTAQVEVASEKTSRNKGRKKK
eukprot:gnl/MRDRNA2_/MRDRNA2_101652_c0_seq1.p1 gnl/MRDRNA2_/MRDRNA2_101652_c0~~gnl/MRDRNA2_/MRDRNA2_101652_c0_seq1.p1  ORF type:complete len:663 (+),score=198.65 gnl/MRDRNA2_/MRDRNA2_101652_c0_seq1:110-2098(+)